MRHDDTTDDPGDRARGAGYVAMVRGLLGFAVLLCMTAGFEALGQATATQGEPEGEQKTERFKSPMTVEVPLDLSPDQVSDHWTEKRDLAPFICDGVSVPMFKIRATRNPADTLQLTMVVSVYNEPGHDKFAHIDMELRIGDTVLASDHTTNIDAEEKKMPKYRIDWSIPTDKLKDSTKAILKVTMKVTAKRV